MNCQLGSWCGFVRGISSLIVLASFVSLCELLHNCFCVERMFSHCWQTEMFVMWPFIFFYFFLPQTTDLTATCSCRTSILVNLRPLGQNSSGVLFSSVRWSLIGITLAHRIYEIVSARARERGRRSSALLPLKKHQLLPGFCLSVTNVFPPCTICTLVTLLQTQLRHEIACVLMGLISFFIAFTEQCR